jgi:hypothetical protein
MRRSEPWNELNHFVQMFTYSFEMPHDTENNNTQHDDILQNDTQHNNKQMPPSA